RPNRPRYVIPAPLRNFEYVGTLPGEVDELLEDTYTVQPVPWVVVLVDQTGKPHSIACVAEDEADANAWCDEWERAWREDENNEAVDELKPYVLPLPAKFLEHQRFDVERKIGERLQLMAGRF